jgi:hypothetical protein
MELKSSFYHFSQSSSSQKTYTSLRFTTFFAVFSNIGYTLRNLRKSICDSTVVGRPTCEIIGNETMGMYLQEVNLKASVVCKMVKNHLGYYMHFKLELRLSYCY